jgi:hypothetical protein
VTPDVGVPKAGREVDELEAAYENGFEPDPNPLKVASFGTGGTGGTYYIKRVRRNAMSHHNKLDAPLMPNYQIEARRIQDLRSRPSWVNRVSCQEKRRESRVRALI